MAKKKINTKKLCMSGAMTCLMVICSWISIPSAIPFTLQTFAVAFCAYYLPIWYALLSLLGYFLLGAVGVPVFAGFNAGVSMLLGPTGGYIIGFFVMIIIMEFGKKLTKSLIGMLSFGGLGLLADYAFGTIWFAFVYLGGGYANLLSVFITCVLPFILFDVIKVFIASLIVSKIPKIE